MSVSMIASRRHPSCVRCAADPRRRPALPLSRFARCLAAIVAPAPRISDASLRAASRPGHGGAVTRRVEERILIRRFPPPASPSRVRACGANAPLRRLSPRTKGACARCRFAHSATATVSASSCGPWTPGLARCARPGNGFADIDAVGRLRACGANPRYGASHRERRRARTCRFAHPAAGTKTRLYAPPSCPRRGRPRLERRSASKT